MTRYLSLFVVLAILVYSSNAQSTETPLSREQRSRGAKNLAVIGYYAGSNADIDSFPTEKLTHIIFSFCHLKGNRIVVDNAYDSARITHLVALKDKHPLLKVILSLGGWGGCPTCTDVFSTDSGRQEFASSVREVCDYFHADGIDLDWEYPALENVPGYHYMAADKDNFTEVIRLLRKRLPRKAEVSFAAGGFTEYLRTSVDWKQVVPMVNYINLMTYDLINGYATQTGHHTALYSRPEQLESTDRAIRWLDSAGVPLQKVAIGLAFYARIFAGADSVNDGLYRPCHFLKGVSYKNFATALSPDSGWVYHWDKIAQAPYMYNAGQQAFASFDDSVSIRIKTEYAVQKGIGGVMFWQMTEDRFSGGLLDVIDDTKTALSTGRKN